MEVAQQLGTSLRYPCRPTTTACSSRASHLVSYINSYFFLANMFQHKYLIYNRDCTLLTYAVQTKIKIDDQASFKDVSVLALPLYLFFPMLMRACACIDKELRVMWELGD